MALFVLAWQRTVSVSVSQSTEQQVNVAELSRSAKNLCASENTLQKAHDRFVGATGRTFLCKRSLLISFLYTYKVKLTLVHLQGSYLQYHLGEITFLRLVGGLKQKFILTLLNALSANLYSVLTQNCFDPRCFPP